MSNNLWPRIDAFIHGEQMTATPSSDAPRFTAEQITGLAKKLQEYRKPIQQTYGLGDGGIDDTVCRASWALEQAAADLASAPTRDELAYNIWLFTHPKTTIEQFYMATTNQKDSAYRRADALISVGVRVRQ